MYVPKANDAKGFKQEQMLRRTKKQKKEKFELEQQVISGPNMNDRPKVPIYEVVYRLDLEPV